MVHALTIIALWACATGQDTKNPTKPSDDDEVVAGLPDGEARPLPARVKWQVSDTITAKTATRERIDLSGFWRFAAVDEQGTAVKRSEMGWIDVPALPSPDGANVFDWRFRDSDGLWRGKPLEKFPFIWVERDIRITNADALEWLNRRIYLVLRGPWADAEIYASQRIAKRAAQQDDDANSDVHVHVEPVTGIERAGGRWCEITEQLLYPGTTQISLRLKRLTATEDAAQQLPETEPYLGLERWASGPRIESMRVERDPDSSEVRATLALERPQGYMILGMPPVRTIPLSLKVRLESADSHMELAKLTEDIGPLTDLKRTVTLRIPWSAPKDASPALVRLHAQLIMTAGPLFDEPFPIEFRPAELSVADK